jgi:hypothetical protein
MPTEPAAAADAATPEDKPLHPAKRPMPVWATVLTTLVTALLPLGYVYLDMKKEQLQTEREAAEVKRKADKAYAVTTPAVNQLITYTAEDHKTLAGYGKDLDLLWPLLSAKGLVPVLRPSERAAALAAALTASAHGSIVAARPADIEGGAIMDTADSLDVPEERARPAPVPESRPRARPRARPRPRMVATRSRRTVVYATAPEPIVEPRLPDAGSSAPDAGPPKKKKRPPIKRLPDRLQQPQVQVQQEL